MENENIENIENNDDYEFLILRSEDGQTEVKCAVLGTFELDETDYIALLPEGAENVMVYSYVDENDDFQLSAIKDDDEFQKVSEVFMELFGEENFEK